MRILEKLNYLNNQKIKKIMKITRHNQKLIWMYFILLIKALSINKSKIWIKIISPNKLILNQESNLL